MVLKVKNWETFQHYKNRNPPWIRLYRGLLDDIEFNSLSGNAAKHLVMIWLVAAESSELDGSIPDKKELSFRLRISEKELSKSLKELAHWLHDDSRVLAGCLQDATPETEAEAETETETETETEHACACEVYINEFDQFWQAYPKKKSKGTAQKAWDKIKDRPSLSHLLAALDAQKRSQDWLKDGGQFIPYPASWLNAGRWEDETRGPVQGMVDHIERLKSEGRLS